MNSTSDINMIVIATWWSTNMSSEGDAVVTLKTHHVLGWLFYKTASTVTNYPSDLVDGSTGAKPYAIFTSTVFVKFMSCKSLNFCIEGE